MMTSFYWSRMSGPHCNYIDTPIVDIRGPSFHTIIMSFYDYYNNIASMGVFLLLIFNCSGKWRYEVVRTRVTPHAELWYKVVSSTKVSTSYLLVHAQIVGDIMSPPLHMLQIPKI